MRLMQQEFALGSIRLGQAIIPIPVVGPVIDLLQQVLY